MTFTKENSEFAFSLTDGSSSRAERQPGLVSLTEPDGNVLAIQVEGYGDCTSTDDAGIPIYLELYEGKLRLIVFGDINSEEPTDVISLEGARLNRRRAS